MDASDDITDTYKIDAAHSYASLEFPVNEDGIPVVTMVVQPFFATPDELFGWEEPPLWATIGSFLDRRKNQKYQDQVQYSTAEFKISRAPIVYFTLLSAILMNPVDREDFVSSLTETQYHSLRLILDWVNATYQRPEIMIEILAFMAVKAMQFLPTDVLDSTYQEYIAGRDYEESMYQLFNFEFAPRRRPPGASKQFPSQLPHVRGMAFNAAFSQRTAVYVYRNREKVLSKSTGPNFILGPEEEPDFDGIFSNTARALKLIRTKWSEISVEKCVYTSTPYADEHGKRILHYHELQNPDVEKHWKPRIMCQYTEKIFYTLIEIIAEARGLLWRQDLELQPIRLTRPGKVGPMITYCPWLSLAEKSGRPGYLWDALERKTIADPGDVEYAAISHTWGRMADWEKPLKQVVNVPWLMVQNTRFDVLEIPNILKQASESLECRYIWLDLVCIPQRNASRKISPQWEKIHHDQVGIQAKIFSGAKHAVAWFSDVDTFDGVKAAVECGTILAMGRSSGVANFIVNPDVMRSIFEQGLSNACELANDSTTDKSLEGVNKWFTSLWTLQEACIRPDMILCDQNWNKLSLNGKQPLKLDGLVCLIDLYRSTNYNSKFVFVDPFDDPTKELISYEFPPPESLKQLSFLLMHSGLDNLVTLTRMRILYQAGRRECSGDRAVAFMSTIGATEWRDVGNSGEGGIMMGQYPYSFVCELRRRLGAAFFSMDCLSEYVRGTLDGVYIGSGSMLPFGFDIATIVPGLTEDEGRQGHPSVDTWSVTFWGFVLIKEAVVISSPRLAIAAESDIMVKLSKNKTWNIIPGEELEAITREPNHIFRRIARAILRLAESDLNKDEIPVLQNAYSLKFRKEIPEGYFGLHQFLQSVPGSYYALLLFHEKEIVQTKYRVFREKIEGIILQEFFIDSVRRFRKVGVFHSRFENVKEFRERVAETLDWIVE